MTQTDTPDATAKHTPGPWMAHFDGPAPSVLAISGPPAVVGWPGFDDSDRPIAEHQANARLIAIAPDLYAFVAAMARVPWQKWSARDMRDMARTLVAKSEERPS